MRKQSIKTLQTFGALFRSRAALYAILVVFLALPVHAQRRTEHINGHEAVANEVLVRFRTEASLAQIQATQNIATTKPVGGIAHLYLLHSPSRSARSLVQHLASRRDVVYAEPNFVVHVINTPNDPSFPQLWGLQNTGQYPGGTPGADISAVPAWGVSVGARGNVVAVVDTGIDYTHPDLAGNVWSAPSSFTVTIGGVSVTCPAGAHGFNAITGTCDPMDDYFHGTHVSGTIGATGNNSIGVVGVNWVSRMMGSKFLDSTGSGTIVGAVNAIEFVVQTKAAFAQTNAANVRVLTNSWGGYGFSQALLDEINRAAASEMLFVAAAGNDSLDNGQYPFYPASYAAPDVIAVAATDDTDQIAWFSNYGRSTVHLGAPGVNILSTVPGATYQSYDGTSMATPHVSGAAMLLLSVCPLNTVGLKAALTGNVDLIPSLATNTITGGRLNVNKAIHYCMNAIGGVSVFPGSVSFGNQVVATTSASTTITLSNHQSGALVINSITSSGDFAIAGNNCGSGLAAGASCTVDVDFTPTISDYETGVLTVADGAGNGPQTVNLSGVGVPPVSLSPSSLGYTAQLVGTTSAIQTVQVTNNEVVPLNFSGITKSGDFVQNNSCGTKVGPGSSCAITVSFTPSATGTRTGTVTIADDAPGNPQTVQLSGTGSNLMPGGFVGTSTLNHGRLNSTATLLTNGQVLIAGGYDENDNPGNTAELYYPGSAIFVLSGTMQQARVQHTATPLNSGKVLVAGGHAGTSYLSGAELYDPAAQIFTSTGRMLNVRGMHTATRLNNGKVLIAGGYDNSQALATAELYDPSTGTFTPTGSMTIRRWMHTATLLNDGTVLITGGLCSPDPNCDSTTGRTASAEVYDPATATFTAVGNMAFERHSHTATLLNNGRVLVAGGGSSTAELYDPPSKTFLPTGAMSFDLGGHTATLLADGTVLVAGGSTTTSYLPAQVYDPATGTFRATRDMTHYRAWHTAAGLTSGLVLIAGGTDLGCKQIIPPPVQYYCLNNVLSSAELYTPQAAATSTVLTSSVNPSTVGQPIMFTATVSSAGGTPAGSVTFYNGNSSLGSATLNSSAQAHLTTANLSAGSHSMTAAYMGNMSFAPSTSAVLTQTVNPIPVTLSPTSLSFSTQAVGTTSPAKAVTLTNVGTTLLTINGIAITGTNAGDFAQTHTCGSSLAAGASCTISVTFKPTASGTRTAALSVSDNAAGSPQKVTLSGIGTTAKLSPTSLSFSTQAVGTTSPAKAVTLTNVGTTLLTINGIAITGTNAGDFAQTHTCGSSLAAGASCTISVTFKPTASGTRTAALSVSDNAAANPQKVTLSGIGTTAKLSPTSLSFGSVVVGTTSAAKTVTLTNIGTTALSITGITITGMNPGDFSQTHTCGTLLAAGTNCTISLKFKPAATGTRSAALSISDNAAGSPQKVSLSGTGT